MTPTEERDAWQAIRDAQIAAWPATPALLTTTQGRAALISDAAAWTPSFDPAMLHPTKPHSTLIQPGVRGEWSRPVSPHGMILYVHGAAQAGSVASYRKWADDLCIASSAYVLNLEYRRPPEFQCADVVNDVLAAMAYLETHNHPVSRMVLAGDSSGAGPILSALLVRRDACLPMPSGVYFLCPKTNYRGQAARPKAPPFDRNPDTCPSQKAFDGYFEVVLASDPLASPIMGNLAGLPPILIQDSSGDIPGILLEARALRDKLMLAGNDCTYREWDTVPHIWPTYGTAFTYSLEAATEAGAWIRDRLGQPGGAGRPATGRPLRLPCLPAQPPE